MSENKEKKLFLLDAFALIYRAHFAFIKRPLINSKGINTSAIAGFINTLWDIIKKEQPTHIAVAFDLPGPTFRHTQYPEYKANRDEQPEDISYAIPKVKEVLQAFNIPILSVENYEADDVVGTIAKQAEKEGFKVYMVTPDKDYAQLISENIFMYKPARSGKPYEILGIKEMQEVFGVEKSEQVIDLLGLQGDAVDNIPGVPGVGPKTAVKLLAEYGDIEGVIANSSKLKGKLRERIEDNVEKARLSRELAVICLDVPITFDADAYIIEEYNKEALEAFFVEMELRSISKRVLGSFAEGGIAPAGVQTDLFGNVVPSKAAPKQKKLAMGENNIENTAHEYILAETKEQRAELIKILAAADTICLDTETTGLDPMKAELVGMSFAVEAGKAWYVPVPSEREAAMAITSEFKATLENPAVKKIGQNIKYDMLILRRYNVCLKENLLDTMVVHYLLEPELRHNMDYMSESLLNYSPVSITKLIGTKGKHQLSMRDVPIAKLTEYAAEDADITLQLQQRLEPELAKMKMESLYWDLEAPLITVLAEMEFEGVNLDSNFLVNYSKELLLLIDEKKAAIYEIAGLEFNIDSPKQVGEVLFTKLEIPYRWRKTKSGQYSTNEEKMSELAADNEIVQKILDYRHLAKLRSTYVEALPKLVNKETGRLHTSYNQALAATGRLSSNNPNLQNIPIRSEAGREIRKAFIPRDENHILLAADYSQIELRMIAHISEDKAMQEAFQKGQDIHSATAAKVYGVDIENVTREQRYHAKTVNFSIVYGAGAFNLSKSLGIKRKEAQELIDNYFKEYSGLKKYMENIVTEARENGYVSTLMGRRRFLRDIESRNRVVRAQAERTAINTPVQGSAADLIKVAMINIQKRFKEENIKSKMILQVHDELIFDTLKTELEQVRTIVEKEMREAMPNLSVPILVGIDTGENWLEAH